MKNRPVLTDNQEDEPVLREQHQLFQFRLCNGILLALMECGSISLFQYRSAESTLRKKLNIKIKEDETDQVRLLLPRFDQ